jgi:hypothetical protein
MLLTPQQYLNDKFPRKSKEGKAKIVAPVYKTLALAFQSVNSG